MSSLNRQSFLNMNSLRPSIAILVKNCYSTQSRLFVVRRTGIASKEGDPVSMEIYDIRVMHLINMLIEILSNQYSANFNVMGYGDDISAARNLQDVRRW